MIISEEKYKEKIKEYTIEQLVHLINNVKLQFPEFINRLSKEQLEIICDVFYDEFSKKETIYKYYDCMDCFFANGLYSAIDYDVRFDFECLKLNKSVLQKYFNYLEVMVLLKIIDIRFKNETKCKVIEYQKKY